MGAISGKLWIVRTLLLTFLLIFVGLIESFNVSQRNFMREGLYTRAKEEMLSIRFRLEASILSDIYAANGLQALVTLRPDGDITDWPQVAASVLRKGKHVQVVGLAPNDVIKYIYPLEGNQAALGLDYRTVPQQWKSINKAREIQDIFISGPVNLVQGGKAIVARVPIFTDPPINSQYWGVCSIVINWDSLFSESGVETFGYSYNFAIRGFDSSGFQGEVFFGESSTFDNAFATEIVNFPYGSWVIAASEKKDVLKQLPWYQSNIVRLQGYPVLLILIILAFIIYRLYTIANERAMFDELTKLPNRRYFMFTLQHFFELAERSKGKNSFAIVNIDLDKFKSINDKYGHDAGDKVLIACSERILSALRASDIVSRMGGDEFLILLPRINRVADLDIISKTIEKAISDSPVIYDKTLLNIHASVGYILYHSKFVDIDDMLKAADEAMYAVKNGLA